MPSSVRIAGSAETKQLRPRAPQRLQGSFADPTCRALRRRPVGLREYSATPWFLHVRLVPTHCSPVISDWQHGWPCGRAFGFQRSGGARRITSTCCDRLSAHRQCRPRRAGNRPAAPGLGGGDEPQAPCRAQPRSAALHDHNGRRRDTLGRRFHHDGQRAARTMRGKDCKQSAPSSWPYARRTAWSCWRTALRRRMRRWTG